MIAISSSSVICCVGYSPKVSFKEGINLTARWYLTMKATGLLDGGDRATQTRPVNRNATHIHPLNRSSDLELRQRSGGVFNTSKHSSKYSPNVLREPRST